MNDASEKIQELISKQGLGDILSEIEVLNG